jgi:hypothetical protein
MLLDPIPSLLLFIYGAVVSYSAVEFKEPPWEYQSWLIVSVFIWGCFLSAMSWYALVQNSFPRRFLTATILGVSYGAFLSYANFKFYQPPYLPVYYWGWFMAIVFVWSGAATTVSIWLVWRRKHLV